MLFCLVFGYPAEHDSTTDSWVFNDTGETVSPESIAIRFCPRCAQRPTEDGHDPCIANLPGVRNACCGHGGALEAYDRETLRYAEALAYFRDQSVGAPKRPAEVA